MKIKPGMEVKVTLLDHAKHSGMHPGLLTFDVYGKVLAVTKDNIVVASWCYQTNEVDDNVECFSVSRGSIKKVRVFR
jgi:hypothetical protein